MEREVMVGSRKAPPWMYLFSVREGDGGEERGEGWGRRTLGSMNLW